MTYTAGLDYLVFVLPRMSKKFFLIEENVHSIPIAQHNVQYNQCNNFEIFTGKVEDQLPNLLEAAKNDRAVVMIDPPRQGLSESAAKDLSSMQNIDHLLYLSCGPEALVRDLKIFIQNGWLIKQITPFDFFPRTKHLEVLVLLERN